jgi:hypothetical protein
MLRVVFKGMKKSNLVVKSIQREIEKISEDSPLIKKHFLVVRVSETKPLTAKSPSRFGVEVLVQRGALAKAHFEDSDSDFFKGLSRVFKKIGKEFK